METFHLFVAAPQQQIMTGRASGMAIRDNGERGKRMISLRRDFLSLGCGGARAERDGMNWAAVTWRHDVKHNSAVSALS